MENYNQHIDFELLTRFLAGETSEEENRLVSNWKESSDENRRQLDELQETWNMLDHTNILSDINVDNEWDYHLKKILPQEKVKTFQLKRLISIAAAVIIGFGIVFYGINLVSTKTIKTQTAQTRVLTLPDGSKITLNAGSKLVYKKDFGKHTRSVALKGEGFFEVTRNPEIPFIINIDNAEIKVLGTSFNVKAYSDMDKIEVTVKEGTVSLGEKNIDNRKVLAIAGERVEFNRSLNTVQKQVNPDRNYISWKTRQIIFENDSLSTILKTLGNVYHTKFILSDPDLGNCTVTTTFENKELTTVFRVLESTLDIKFNNEGDKIVISGKGCR